MFFFHLPNERIISGYSTRNTLANTQYLSESTLLPDAANPWDSLGDYYVEAGNTEEARKAFEKALEIDPSFSASQRKLDELNNPSEAS